MSEFHNQFEQEQIDLARVKRIRKQDEPKWSTKAQEQLTAFMLGLPTEDGYNFQIIAGKPIEKVRITTSGQFRRLKRNRPKGSKNSKPRADKIYSNSNERVKAHRARKKPVRVTDKLVAND